MTDRPSPSLDEARRAIARQRSGLLDPADTSPGQAAALWKLGLLTATDIGRLASSWLERGLDHGSAELASIALGQPSSLSDVGSSFEAALAEMGVAIPSLDEPVLVTLELYLRAMIEGRVSPMTAMAAINDLYYDRGEARLHHPYCNADDPQSYLGEELGLEHLYTWYRELQDAESGSILFYYNELPRDQQRASLKRSSSQKPESCTATYARATPKFAPRRVAERPHGVFRMESKGHENPLEKHVSAL